MRDFTLSCVVRQTFDVYSLRDVLGVLHNCGELDDDRAWLVVISCKCLGGLRSSDLRLGLNLGLDQGLLSHDRLIHYRMTQGLS